MAQLPPRFRGLFSAVLMFLFLGSPVLAADITAVRSWRAPDNTRLVLDLSSAVTWQISPDSTPARLVLEIEGARLAGPVALPAVQPPLKAIRFEPTARGQRLIIDTALELLPKAFQLAPNEKYGHRLVLDLYEKGSPRLALGAAAASADGAVARPADGPVARPLDGPVARPADATPAAGKSGTAGASAAGGAAAGTGGAAGVAGTGGTDVAARAAGTGSAAGVANAGGTSATGGAAGKGSVAAASGAGGTAAGAGAGTGAGAGAGAGRPHGVTPVMPPITPVTPSGKSSPPGAADTTTAGTPTPATAGTAAGSATTGAGAGTGTGASTGTGAATGTGTAAGTGTGAGTAAAIGTGTAAGTATATGKASPEPPLPDTYDRNRYRDIIVAIDAGHGGEDPGAIGKDGTYEKHVTLAIAKELQARLQAEPGITAVLTRTGDYFLPLQDRRRIARYQHKADIFVSIHADAAENRAARGASVFALSLKGAGSATSRFARMLAERENRADLIGGANLENEDNVLRNVLADMVVAGSLEHSLHMGRNILQGLERLTRLHSPRVEQAGFAVLKEPGMVSLLVETGFISNPDEEKKLTSKDYQQELARVIAAGVRRYCAQYPVPSTYFAWRADRERERARVADNRGPRRPRADTAAKPEAARVADAATTRSAGLVEPPVQMGAATPAPVLVAATTATAAGRAGEKVASDKAGSARADRDKATSDKTGRDKAAAPRFRTHKVARGDSLTRLAAQYGVSMAALREANRLRDDNIQVGQTLKIPVN